VLRATLPVLRAQRSGHVLQATALLANLGVAGTIADYDPTPQEVVAAILAAVDAETPPLRLATGRVAATEIRAALTARLAELDQPR
jgi:hypothetical protein